MIGTVSTTTDIQRGAVCSNGCTSCQLERINVRRRTSWPPLEEWPNVTLGSHATSQVFLDTIELLDTSKLYWRPRPTLYLKNQGTNLFAGAYGNSRWWLPG